MLENTKRKTEKAKPTSIVEEMPVPLLIRYVPNFVGE